MDSDSGSNRKFGIMKRQTILIVLNILFLVVKSSSASVEETDVNIAYYEEIKDLPNHPEILLIDVREPHELEETGRIPSSINIPLSMVEEALSKNTSSESFKELYGKNKPELDAPIIFSCRSGRRSLIAYRKAESLGYKNIKNYEGSWLDWAAHENLPTK